MIVIVAVTMDGLADLPKVVGAGGDMIDLLDVQQNHAEQAKDRSDGAQSAQGQAGDGQALTA
jgi:hypothetical protein